MVCVCVGLSLKGFFFCSCYSSCDKLSSFHFGGRLHRHIESGHMQCKIARTGIVPLLDNRLARKYRKEKMATSLWQYINIYFYFPPSVLWMAIKFQGLETWQDYVECDTIEREACRRDTVVRYRRHAHDSSSAFLKMDIYFFYLMPPLETRVWLLCIYLAYNGLASLWSWAPFVFQSNDLGPISLARPRMSNTTSLLIATQKRLSYTIPTSQKN